MKKELLSIKVQLIIKNNCYERGNRYGGWGFNKNVLVMYFIFGSNNISTKVGRGILVIVVKWKHMVLGLIPCKLFLFHKNYSNPPKKAELIRANL